MIDILRASAIDPITTLPCEKISLLLSLIESSFLHIPLTREEEGVGICAGAALCGKRPAMFIQSSGFGNMLNAIMSLTKTYDLPLSIFVSWRGMEDEKIPAQIPMGRALPGILEACGIEYLILREDGDLRLVRERLQNACEGNKISVFLMSPSLWGIRKRAKRLRNERSRGFKVPKPKILLPRYTRFELIETLAPYLGQKIVVSNLGIPSKELFYIKHQPSNFYMLGSMGMATPIGLGISLFTRRDVLVIDGDGSLLMNPGTLGTVAYLRPGNLTILAIDNGSYGSTGDQPTLTSRCADLEIIARGFGISNTAKVSTKRDLIEAISKKTAGPRFIHALALPGNRDVPNIPLTPLEIKETFSSELCRGESH